MSVQARAGIDRIRYCLTCRHALDTHGQSACPECGRRFDPDDPSTTADARVTQFLRGLANVVRLLAIGAAIAVPVSIVMSALMVDPLLLWLSAFLTAPFVLAALPVACTPMVPVGRRTRVVAIAGVCLTALTIVTDWPMRLMFLVHRPSLAQLVDGVRSGRTPLGPIDRRIGVFDVTHSAQDWEGNIGLQLTGGLGGGIFIVKRDPTSTAPWVNTNWERPLGDGWYLVYED